MKVRHTLFLMWYGVLAVFSTAVAGQDFPSKTVRIIVPFPPGAGPDIVGRTVGQKLTGRWKQQIVVDNRPGAGGNIGVEAAAKAAPDGYTLLLASNHVTINPSLFKKVPYDPIRDFLPLTLATVTPNILVVHPSLPVKSVRELIALAKSRPGQINFSSGGNGSVGHLAAEMFKTAAKVDMVHIPYKGPAAAITALLNGEASVGFLLAAAALPQIKAGKLRALAVTGKNRSPAAPDLPTVSESGVPGYEIVSWQGLFAPAGTPNDVVKKIHSDMVAALNMPDVRRALLAQGLETVADTPEEFSEYIRRDLAKWAGVVREANVHVD
jgi:tripartite-type tricarboxylate transporter receptor subunit TctC